jgi:hypothetical protein
MEYNCPTTGNGGNGESGDNNNQLKGSAEETTAATPLPWPSVAVVVNSEKNNQTKKEYTAQRCPPRPLSASSAAAVAASSTIAIALPPSHTNIAATATTARHIPGVSVRLPIMDTHREATIAIA